MERSSGQPTFPKAILRPLPHSSRLRLRCRAWRRLSAGGTQVDKLVQEIEPKRRPETHGEARDNPAEHLHQRSSTAVSRDIAPATPQHVHERLFG